MFFIVLCFFILPTQVDRTSQRAVEEYEGHAWANSKGFHYFETSAASGDGISELFEVTTVDHLTLI